MNDFVNKIEFNDQIYQTNGTVGGDNYKRKFLFTMKYFVSFETDCKSIFFMSTIFLKYNTYGVHVPQSQLAYVHDTKHPSSKILVGLCSDMHYMWLRDEYLELQE